MLNLNGYGLMLAGPNTTLARLDLADRVESAAGSRPGSRRWPLVGSGRRSDLTITAIPDQSISPFGSRKNDTSAHFAVGKITRIRLLRGPSSRWTGHSVIG